MSLARPIDQVVGMRIGERRRLLKLSLNELAVAAGVPPADLRQVERGEKRPGADQLTRIATALQTTMAELLTPEG